MCTQCEKFKNSNQYKSYQYCPICGKSLYKTTFIPYYYTDKK